MPRILNITIAVLICSTFIFRLLFINIDFGSFFNSKQSGSCTKTHQSISFKKKRNLEIVNSPKSCECDEIEVCEENSNDDDDQFKVNCFFLVQTLYSLSTDSRGYNLKKVPSLSEYFSCISCCKYLAFHSFRI